jgi:hypothetical protein
VNKSVFAQLNELIIDISSHKDLLANGEFFVALENAWLSVLINFLKSNQFCFTLNHHVQLTIENNPYQSTAEGAVP